MRKLLGAAILALGMVSSIPFASATKLGIVAYQMSVETQARVANAAKAAAEDKGWEATIVDAAGSAATQATQLDGFVQKGFDGIILAMGRPAQAEEALKAAQARKIPVISVMSGAHPRLQFDVSVNEYAIGAEIGIYLLGLLDYQGAILVSRFDAQSGIRGRARVLDAMLEEHQGVKVLETVGAGRPMGTTAETKAAIEQMVGHHAKKFKGVWTSTDAQAFLVDDILQAQGYKKGQVLVTGVDGGQESFRRIRDPKSLMTATVAIPFELMGEASVDAMDDLLSGVTKEEISPGPYLFMDAVLVDQNNVPPEGEWPW